MILLNWKLILPPHHFGLFVPLNQAKKGVGMLVGVTDPGHQEERGLLLYNGGEEEYVRNREDPLGILLVIKVSGKLQQPNPGKTTTGPEPSRMKLWVTPPCKELWPTEVLAEGKKNTEWIVEKGKYQNDQVTSFKNENCNFHEYFLLVLLWICTYTFEVFFSLLSHYLET